MSAVDLEQAVPRLRRRDIAVAFAFATVLAVYLLAPPRVPDLAAQVARTELVHRVGLTVWWPGWFGGLHLPTYSALTPMLMSVLTPPLTGALAAVAAAAAMSRLLRSSLRPTAGLIAFLVTDTANLLDGRITFGVGLATGLWCLVSMRQSPTRRRAATTAVLAVLTCLTSPLAGLFLGLATGTRLIVHRSSVRHPLTVSLLVAGSLAATALLFPGAGSMPFDFINLLPALACAAGVAVFCREPLVRVGAAVYLLVLVAFVVYPGAVGVNATRLAWVFTVPLLVAWAPVSRRTVAVIALAAALLPAVDLGKQLVAASDPSSQSVFYQPLVAALGADQAARPHTLGQRLEVVDTRNHWASAQIARHQALARGWERQADRANNPIFYATGPLDPAGYHAWLTELAVGWVAVPAAELDYASVREEELVSTGLPYLKAIWSNDDWTLYRVENAASLASPGSVLEIDDRGLTIAAQATTVNLAVRWSRYLVVTSASGELVAGCVGERDGWTFVRVPTPGPYRIVADFDGRLRGLKSGCDR
ncbi:MAG: hypothetical protein ABJA93_02345 [Sporichthyaceae bacterium]